VTTMLTLAMISMALVLTPVVATMMMQLVLVLVLALMLVLVLALEASTCRNQLTACAHLYDLTGSAGTSAGTGSGSGGVVGVAGTGTEVVVDFAVVAVVFLAVYHVLV